MSQEEVTVADTHFHGSEWQKLKMPRQGNALWPSSSTSGNLLPRESSCRWRYRYLLSRQCNFHLMLSLSDGSRCLLKTTELRCSGHSSLLHSFTGLSPLPPSPPRHTPPLPPHSLKILLPGSLSLSCFCLDFNIHVDDPSLFLDHFSNDLTPHLSSAAQAFVTPLTSWAPVT